MNFFSASGCPHANKNRARSIETSLGMAGAVGAGGLLKYGGLIKPSIHSVPYPAPPGEKNYERVNHELTRVATQMFCRFFW